MSAFTNSVPRSDFISEKGIIFDVISLLLSRSLIDGEKKLE
jgi:hypothetical protein